MNSSRLEQAHKRLLSALDTLESAFVGKGDGDYARSQVEELEARIISLQKERDAALAEKASLQDRYNDLAEAFEGLRAERPPSPSEKLPEVDDLRQAYDELEGAYNDLQDELIALRSSVPAPDGEAGERLKAARDVQDEIGRRLDVAISQLEKIAG